MHVGTLVDYGEAHWYEQCRDEVGHKGVGGHLFEIATKLLRNHWCCRCAWTDDACEHSFGSYERSPRKPQRYYGERQHHYGEHLHCRHPPMPWYGTHTLKVDLAERDEENAEHKHWQQSIEHGVGSQGKGIELWRQGKNEIYDNARSYCHGQSPILYKLNYVHNV